ncbi:MAG: tyrosine-type recombinase/integrase [Pleurocapsa sp. MO_226.B13]|nr:tyrosine-type recombinase/integrase [Pleurocapsa sp. MO_226.B13]
MQGEEVKELINAASTERDRLILTLLYILGLRISELVGLNWSDFQSTGEAIAVTIFGKGHKTRTLLNTSCLSPKSSKVRMIFRKEKSAAQRILID